MKNVVRWLSAHPRTLAVEPDDPQAHRVYRFESALCGNMVGAVSEEFLLQILKSACRTWRVKPPNLEIVQSKERLYGWIVDADDTIYLNARENGNNVPTLLHEVAHHIVYAKGYSVDDHGPEFMWIYIELMEQFKILPREAALVLCQKYNIEVG